MKITLIAFLSAVWIAQAQEPPKKQPKAFSPPETTFYWQGGYLIKDRECAADYAKALSHTGLARQKMLADLVKFECAEKVPVATREPVDTRNASTAKVIGMADFGDPPK